MTNEIEFSAELDGKIELPKLPRLTRAQSDVLQTTEYRTHTGRGGWHPRTLEALAKLGLVRKGRVHTYETDWELTTEGVRVSRALRTANRLAFPC